MEDAYYGMYDSCPSLSYNPPGYVRPNDALHVYVRDSHCYF